MFVTQLSRQLLYRNAVTRINGITKKYAGITYNREILTRKLTTNPEELSYKFHPGKIPITEMTVGQLIGRAADNWPDREAVVSIPQGIRMTYKDVLERVDRIAAGLKNLGLKPGDRVGLWGPNHVEWYLSFLAITRAGFVTVGINPAYQQDEFNYCANRVGVRAIIACDKYKYQDYVSTIMNSRKAIPSLQHVIFWSQHHVPGAHRLVDIEAVASRIEVEAIHREQENVSPRDACNIQFTSGTTGVPKAPLLSHRSFVNNGIQLKEGERRQIRIHTDSHLLLPSCVELWCGGLLLGPSHYHVLVVALGIAKSSAFPGFVLERSKGCLESAEREGLTKSHHRVCFNVPLFHAFGVIQGIMAGIHSGATLVFESVTFNARTSVAVMAKEKCTIGYGTPTMWINMCDAQSQMKAPIDTMRIALTGGANASPELMKRMKETLNLETPMMIYGMTECTAVAFSTIPGEEEELTHTTVGYLADHLEAKVVDEKGSTVPFGTAGELWVRGYSVMMRYWNDPAATASAINEEGWLKTGDKFILRKDGYGHVVGRIKDVIIRGGENIYPKEIENFLETHPAIVEAHAFGVHDNVYGEEIFACIRLKENAEVSADEIRLYGKGKISHFKIPRYVQTVSEFPKTASGKIQRFKLREEVERKGLVPVKNN